MERLASLLIAIVLATAAGSVARAGSVEVPLPSGPVRDDLELTDVCFVDAERGWAVGERGSIWHTADGGASWEPQTSGVTCRLESVSFVDANNGWAVGGEPQPLIGLSLGTILRTRDGGRKWERESKALLPGLRRVKFVSPLVGWAYGDACALYGSGLFFTDDGGREWTPAAGFAGKSIDAGDFIDKQTGAVAAQHEAAVVTRRVMSASDGPLRGRGQIRALRMCDPALAWAVGDGGLVGVTHDGGRTWNYADREGYVFPGTIDLRAVAVHGKHCWVAGSPGSRVYYTPDGGRNWQTFATGHSAPISAMAFVDANHGWAVGALGTVLATHDGGRTWRRQLGRAESTAVLVVSAEAEGLPVELLAKLSAADGYLTVASVVARRDLDGPSPAAHLLASRTQTALTDLDVSYVTHDWQFPLRQRGVQTSTDQVIGDWKRAVGEDCVERLEAALVRQIRQWRPEVIVAGDAHLSANDPVAAVVQQAVLRAAERAADARECPEQITELGLATWSPKKVYALLPPGHAGTLTVSTSQLSPRLGETLADLAAPARCLLHDGRSVAPASLALRLVGQENVRGDFFSGITLPAGSPLKRDSSNIRTESLGALRKSANKRRNLQAIVSASVRGQAGGAQLIAQLDDMLRGLDDDAAGDLLYELGHQYAVAGRHDLADQAFDALGSRLPRHRLAAATESWQLAYRASGEVAWRMKRSPSPGERRESEFIPALQIERTRPMLYAEPRIALLALASLRGRADQGPAERLIQSLRRSRTTDGWTASRATELWLLDGRGGSPKPIARPKSIAARPQLDGQLDDAAWKDAPRLELKSRLRDDDAWPATVQLAADREYLMVAVQCRKAPGVEYPKATTARGRDADMKDRDRVELLIDLDRDGTTFYRLAVDSRGFTADELWHDRTWDPSWYVAAGEDEESWTVELAIPWSELAVRPPDARQPWGLGVQRVVPGAGFQSWTPDATVEGYGPGFGLLIAE